MTIETKVSENPEINFTPYQALKIIELDHIAARFHNLDKVLHARNGKPFKWNDLEINPRFAFGVYLAKKSLQEDLVQESLEDAVENILRSHT